MAHRKRRVMQHIMEDDSMRILNNYLPREWVVRKYNPDYGIDLIVEIFDYVDQNRTVCEALGEMFLVQLKSVQKTEIVHMKVFARGNVEKGPLQEDKSHFSEIDVIKFSLDTDEILTVSSMGSGIPVFLVLVCLDSQRVFHICLNDLIEKVIVPTDPNYTNKASKTIYIPVKNEITTDPRTLWHLRFLAKRTKFYSAFMKFTYQANELSYSDDIDDTQILTLDGYKKILKYFRLALHFIQIIKRYDIWEAGDTWSSLQDIYESVITLEGKIESSLNVIMNTPEEHLHLIPEKLPDFQYMPPLIINHIKITWDRLANLPDVYEEVCREWGLPTYLSNLLS